MAHCRGGALLHPKSLAGSQGLSGRAMLAPTIESQKSDIFLRKPCLLLVGACIAGPPTVRGKILWFAAAANTGRASPAPTAKSRNSAYNQTHYTSVLQSIFSRALDGSAIILFQCVGIDVHGCRSLCMTQAVGHGTDILMCGDQQGS